MRSAGAWRLAAGLLCAAAIPAALASEHPFEWASEPTQTTLVELFTSEGCSSCPAADAWLAKLDGSPRLWHELIPIALHVDYWDRLGWEDRLARPEFTLRQRAYAKSWGADVVATPTVVVNGAGWEGWLRGEPVPAPSLGEVGVLRVAQVGADVFEVRFAPAFLKERQFHAHGALLGFGLTTDVKGGENKGRQLRHEFAALGYAQARFQPGPEGLAASLPLAASAEHVSSRTAAVFWVTAEDTAAPVQAVGGLVPARAP